MDAQKSAALRNRENQRKSRARRKDYIQELEQRIRQYETSGVRATVEVQAAARKVSEENTSLRSLLGMFGLDDGGVDDFLRTRDASSLQDNGKGSLDSYKDILMQENPSQAMEKGVESRLKPPDASPQHQNLMHHNSMTLAHGLTPPESVVSTDIIGRGDAELAPNNLCSPSCRPNPLAPNDDEQIQSRSAQDEISCLAAAEIIASMRGHDNAEAVWPELGCSSSRNCMVKNIAIFQIMDQ